MKNTIFTVIFSALLVCATSCEKESASNKAASGCDMLSVSASFENGGAAKVTGDNSADGSDIEFNWVFNGESAQGNDIIYGYFNGNENNFVVYEVSAVDPYGKASFKLIRGDVYGVREGTIFSMMHIPGRTLTDDLKENGYSTDFSSQKGSLEDAVNHTCWVATGTVVKQDDNSLKLELKFLNATSIIKVYGLERVNDLKSQSRTPMADGDSLFIYSNGGLFTQGTLRSANKDGNVALEFSDLQTGSIHTAVHSTGEGEISAYFAVPTDTTISNIEIATTIDGVRYCWIDSNDQPIMRNHCYRLSSKVMHRIGIFSISDNKKVFIAPGNLQYQPSTKSWRFALHQWDFIGGATRYNTVSIGNVPGNSNNYISDSEYTGWIDLFGYGTSGTNYPPDTYLEAGAYSTNDISGTSDDWGVTCGIDSENGPWRTMNKGEWDYLVSRIWNGYKYGGNSAKRYNVAIVNGVSGAVLIPDDFTDPLTNENAKNAYFVAKKDNNDSSINVYNGDNWSAMERRGAIFLPITGYRIADVLADDSMEMGFYWIGENESSNLTEYCYLVTINSIILRTSDARSNYLGAAVRLVREIPSE